MGSAASVLQAEAGRPLDGSDIESTEQAVAEVQRLRGILANASVLPEPWLIYEDENGYVYYYNSSTNDVQWNHPLSSQSGDTAGGVEAEAPSPTQNSARCLQSLR